MSKIKTIIWKKRQSVLSEGNWYIGYIGNLALRNSWNEVAQIIEDGYNWCLQVHCGKNPPIRYYLNLTEAQLGGQQIFDEFIRSSITED